jgi:predicted dehydrogenase
MDGGVMLNQAVHDIDCLQWLLGGVDEVRASLGYRHRDIECESAAVLSLRTETGAVGSVSATTATKGGRDRIDLNGTEGSLGLSDTGISYFETGTGEESYYGAETESRDVDEEALERAEGHAAVVRDFVDALREGREPAVPGRAARSAVDVVLAAYASDERGEAVSVADVRAGQVPEARSGSGEAGPRSE